MNLEEVKQLWQEDSEIDETFLAREALRGPKLHSKYLDLLINAKMKSAAYSHDLARKQLLKARYYRGELNKDELAENNLQQYQFNKPIRSELDALISADPDCIKIKQKIDYMQIMVMQLESILGAIKQRGWDIKSAVEWKKFEGGM